MTLQDIEKKEGLKPTPKPTPKPKLKSRAELEVEIKNLTEELKKERLKTAKLKL
jgi:hypothetical protein